MAGLSEEVKPEDARLSNWTQKGGWGKKSCRKDETIRMTPDVRKQPEVDK